MSSIKLSSEFLLAGLFIFMSLYLFAPADEKYNLLLQEKKELKTKLYILKSQSVFLNKNEKDYKKLKEKGWNNSFNRIHIYKKIQEISEKYHPLKIFYHCYPEVKNKSFNNAVLKSTTIKMKILTLDEKIMMNFITTLIDQFPGVIVPQLLKIKKSSELSKNLYPTLLTEKILDGLEAEFLFEWISLK